MRNFLFLWIDIVCLGLLLVGFFLKEASQLPLAGNIKSASIVLENKVEDDVFTVAFYNVENLFDTEDDPHSNDNQFLPNSSKKWTIERYNKKLLDLSEVICKLGDEDGPEILGMCEVENRKVIQDLIVCDRLEKHNFEFIHYDSPDVRGIDVALLYKKGSFQPFMTSTHAVKDYIQTRMRTRDILLVGGVTGGDTLFIFTNHWPSRIGGKEASEEKRIAVAQILKFLKDSLQNHYPDAGFLFLGDFNDEPMDNTIYHVLGASESYGTTELFNPFYRLSKLGKGTTKFRSNWYMLDQIIISESLMTSNSKKGLRFKIGNDNADIFNPLWLYDTKDPLKGPFRTFNGNKYSGGFSDHFPVYINFSRN